MQGKNKKSINNSKGKKVKDKEEKKRSGKIEKTEMIQNRNRRKIRKVVMWEKRNDKSERM